MGVTLLAGAVPLRSRIGKRETGKKTSMPGLSLDKRLWGGGVSGPPVKAGAERKKKTAFQGFFWREGTPEGRRAGGAGTLPRRSRVRSH